MTCGTGSQLFHRECEIREGYGDIDDFCTPTCDEGSDQETRECNAGCCPHPGDWTSWVQYGSCSTTCGLGSVTYHRSCELREGYGDGDYCTADCGDGERLKEETCQNACCEHQGRLSEWAQAEDCDVTCGGGQALYTRECRPRRRYRDNPDYCTPVCDESLSEYRTCNDECCDHVGEWASWDEWGSCSETCGVGNRKRRRECEGQGDYDEATHCAPGCSGRRRQVEDCLITYCPLDGGWSTWAWDGPCSVTCGGGVRVAVRTCTDPSPEYGGEDCEGDDQKTRSCKNTPCLPSECVCRLLGDPLLDSFGGEFSALLDLGVTNMARMDVGDCRFSVDVKIGSYNGALKIPKWMKVQIRDTVIKIGQGRRIEYIDSSIDDDTTGNNIVDGISVIDNNSSDNPYVVVSDEACNLQFGFDPDGLKTLGLVVVSSEYSGNLEGDCGDCTGN